MAAAVLVALVVLIVVASVLVGTRSLQYWIVFNPSSPSGPYQLTHAIRPRDVHITKPGGGSLHGWYIEEPVPPSVLPAETAILFLHGRSNNISRSQRDIAFLSQLRLPILAVDYTGYGRSSGRPSEEQCYRDAATAFDYLKARHGRVVAYGYSMGGAIAARLAAVERRDAIAGVALVSTFHHLSDATPGVLHVFRSAWNDVFPTGRTLEKRGTSCPVLVGHSRDDTLISLTSARRIHGAVARHLPQSHVRFHTMRGRHTQVVLDDEFLQSVAWLVAGATTVDASKTCSSAA